MTDSISSSDMNKYLWCPQHFWSSSITSRSREGAASHTHPWRKPQGAFPSRRALRAAITPHQTKPGKLRFRGALSRSSPSPALLTLHSSSFCPAVALSIQHLLLDTNFSPSPWPSPRKCSPWLLPETFQITAVEWARLPFTDFSWNGTFPHISLTYVTFSYNYFSLRCWWQHTAITPGSLSRQRCCCWINVSE